MGYFNNTYKLFKAGKKLVEISYDEIVKDNKPPITDDPLDSCFEEIVGLMDYNKISNSNLERLVLMLGAVPKLISLHCGCWTSPVKIYKIMRVEADKRKLKLNNSS